MENKIEQLPTLLQDPSNVSIIKEIRVQGGKARPRDLIENLKNKMSRPTLFNRLKALIKEGFLSSEYERGDKGVKAYYKITEKTERLFQWAKDATSLNEIVATWPACAREYKFTYDWGAEIKTKTGTIRYIGDSALGINVSYKGERSAIVDIYGARVKGVEETLIREILGAAKALGLLDEEYFTGEKSWREIPLEDLDAAFRKIFGETQEIVYIESLTVQKLLRWLRQPSVTDYLGQLSDEDPSMPDYTPFSNEVFTRGR